MDGGGTGLRIPDIRLAFHLIAFCEEIEFRKQKSAMPIYSHHTFREGIEHPPRYVFLTIPGNALSYPHEGWHVHELLMSMDE